MSKWTDHKKKWSFCTACPLHERRKKVVLARGKLPCDMLFVGEAPGASEDVLGRPFIGPAGKLLDSIIEEAVPDEVSIGFTNLVACIPKDESGSKTKEPEQDHIIACSNRLEEILKMAKPAVLIMVGKLSEKWMPSQFGDDIAETWISVIHPAALLRMDASQKPLAIQRTIVTLRDAAEELTVPF